MQGNQQNGILIAIEGIDGAGKTTQVVRLRDALLAAGEGVVDSKEPTTGQWGQRIRHSALYGRMRPEEELKAFLADRAEHVEKLIAPALAQGKIVIVDRYFYSTVAYQGGRSGADPCELYAEMRRQFPVPDATYLVDVLPEVGLHRIAELRGDIPNEFERLDDLRHIRESFLRLRECAPELRFIDGHPGIETVFQQIAHDLVDGPLRSKRCAKPYGCDIFFCSYRENGECVWSNERDIILKSSTRLPIA